MSQPPSSTSTELRVLERVPVDVALPVQLLVVPLEQLQVVLGLVVTNPLDEAVVGDPRLALRAPELRRPRVDAVVVVEPVVTATLDRLLRVVLEVVEHRDRRIAGELRRLLADQLVGAQVTRRVVLVGIARVRAQMDTGERVVRDVARDVRARDDGLDHRARLGLGGRKRPGAGLLALGSPLHREVAVEIESLERRRDLDRDPVVVADRALPEQPVVLAAFLVGVAAHHQARLLGMRLPGAVRIAHAHHQARARRRPGPPRAGRPARRAAGTDARSSARSAAGRPTRAPPRRG